MFEIMLALILLMVIYIGYIVSGARHSQSLPPMPSKPLPIVGHLLELGSGELVPVFQKWKKNAGGIWSVYLGSKLYIMVANYDYVKELFVKQAQHFSDRPPLHGLAFAEASDGEVAGFGGMYWKEHRKVSLSILRSLGMGRELMADMIKKEIQTFLEELAKLKGKVCDLHSMLIVSVTNIIMLLLMGRQFEYNNPDYNHTIELLENQLQILPKLFMLDAFWWMKYIPGDPFGASQYQQNYRKIVAFFREYIEKCKGGKNVGEESFINSYAKEASQSHSEAVSEQQLEPILYILLAGGADSSVLTMLWTLLVAVTYPDKQKKMYEEIKTVIGTSRLPKLEDRSQMHYTNSFIAEIQRYRNLTVTVFPRVCQKTTQIGGYTIPEGALLMPMLDIIMQEEKLWGDPREFRPERYLDADGKFSVPEYHIPFFIGRRSCLGEGMAKAELFLYITSILQRFEVLPEDPNNLPNLEPHYNYGCIPQSSRFRLVQRV